MKAKITTLIMCLWAIQLIAQEKSQVRREYWDKPGWYTFGLSGGSNLLNADVKRTFQGWGINGSFGKNILYTSPLLINLRARLEYNNAFGLDATRDYRIGSNPYLNGQNGPDYTKYTGVPNITQGFVFQNYRHDMGSLGIDFLFTLNKLRERTGWVATLYGGAQLAYYNARINQIDEDGNKDYKTLYASIDTTSDKLSIKDAICNGLDNSYETQANGFAYAEDHWGFMPYAGFELGYELTPSFTLGVGHRITWSQKDNLDGSILKKAGQDVGHYSFLNLEWKFRPKPIILSPPEIIVDIPMTNDFQSNDPEFDIAATIKNIKKSSQISFFQDDNNQAFVFYRPKLTSKVILHDGVNYFKIKAVNDAGSDEEVFRISYKEPKAEKRPTVKFMQPSQAGSVVNNSDCVIKAATTEIFKGDKIFLELNGQPITGFYLKKGEVSDGITLREGYNVLKIRVENQFGYAEDNTSILYEKPIPGPVVDIYAPGKGSYSTEVNREYVKARISNVDNRNQIRLFYNGTQMSDFDWNGSEVRFYASNLKLGQNSIRVEATNKTGNASEELLINYQEKKVEIQPVVSWILGHSVKENSVTKMCEWSAEAKVQNVATKEQIEVRLDGQIVPFTYSGGKAYVLANIKEGKHELHIIGYNTSGKSEDRISTTCSITSNLPKPLITFVNPMTSPTSTESNIYKLSARIENVASTGDIRMSVNGKSVYDFRFNGGLLTSDVLVNDGANSVEIQATNQSGSAVGSVQITKIGGISLSRKPTVEILTPKMGQKFENNSTKISAIVKLVGHKDNIDLFINNKRTDIFNYNPTSFQLDAMCSLVQGENTIRIKGRNQAGEAETSVKVYYEIKASAPPVVNISQPTTGRVTDQNKMGFEGKVTNVSSKDNIQIRVNGNLVSEFAFNTMTGMVATTVSLSPGVNQINLSATNGDGSDSKSVNVTYNIPVALPIINFNNPKQVSSMTTQKSVVINASILNVQKKDIVLFIDGRNVPDFQWDESTKTLTYSLALNKGENNIRIDASNPSGNQTASRKIQLLGMPQLAPPTVKIESVSIPTENPFEPGVAKSSFVISTTNISDKASLKITSNDVVLNEFSFDTTTKVATGVIKLTKGKNTLKVVVTNQAGTAESTREIEY